MTKKRNKGGGSKSGAGGGTKSGNKKPRPSTSPSPQKKSSEEADPAEALAIGPSKSTDVSVSSPTTIERAAADGGAQATEERSAFSSSATDQDGPTASSCGLDKKTSPVGAQQPAASPKNAASQPSSTSFSTTSSTTTSSPSSADPPVAKSPPKRYDVFWTEGRNFGYRCLGWTAANGLLGWAAAQLSKKTRELQVANSPFISLFSPVTKSLHYLPTNTILSTLSGSCCALQLFLNMFSVGCAGFNTVLGPWRPFFLSLTFLSQGFGMYQAAVVNRDLDHVKNAMVSSFLALSLAFLPEFVFFVNNDEIVRKMSVAGGSSPSSDEAAGKTVHSFSPDPDREAIIELQVEGMGCVACVNAIRGAIETSKQVPVNRVLIQLEKGLVTVLYWEVKPKAVLKKDKSCHGVVNQSCSSQQSQQSLSKADDDEIALYQVEREARRKAFEAALVECVVSAGFDARVILPGEGARYAETEKNGGAVGTNVAATSFSSAAISACPLPGARHPQGGKKEAVMSDGGTTGKEAGSSGGPSASAEEAGAKLGGS
ncbi:unnamed protein product [Amoebophrya sp. A120]|nr:unnamed protein product [Amoebophrya sp. A120]|eukprot:GSA120T00000835001.1